MIGESHGAYKVVLDTLFEFTLKQSRESVLIIASDCILNQEFVDFVNYDIVVCVCQRFGTRESFDDPIGNFVSIFEFPPIRGGGNVVCLRFVVQRKIVAGQ